MSIKIGTRIPPKLASEGLEKVASWASSIGLDVLDLPTLTAEEKQICQTAGIGIGSVDAVQVGQLLSRDEARRASAADALKKHMDNIAQFGARVLFMCLVPEDRTAARRETFDIWKESFPELVRHAEQRGIYIAIEGWPGPAPHYPTIGCTPEMWRAMFEAIPSRNFGLNYDPSHLVRLGVDYLRVLTEFGDRINHCHGKDTEILHDDLYECGILPATFGAKYAFSEGSWRYTIP
ncbi:MAG: xylose isomerase-like barrel protein, partial [Bacilli bacterium]|nr:xylose isomerase-like barrel protein [Bacilli bacterium]